MSRLLVQDIGILLHHTLAQQSQKMKNVSGMDATLFDVCFRLMMCHIGMREIWIFHDMHMAALILTHSLNLTGSTGPNLWDSYVICVC